MFKGLSAITAFTLWIHPWNLGYREAEFPKVVINAMLKRKFIDSVPLPRSFAGVLFVDDLNPNMSINVYAQIALQVTLLNRKAWKKGKGFSVEKSVKNLISMEKSMGFNLYPHFRHTFFLTLPYFNHVFFLLRRKFFITHNWNVKWSFAYI